MLGSLVLSAPVATAEPPSNAEPPTLSGTQPNGDVYVGVHAVPAAGRWEGTPPPTFSYRWQYLATNGKWPDTRRDRAFLEVQPGDLGRPLRVNVTATNGDGPPAEQVSARPTR